MNDRYKIQVYLYSIAAAVLLGIIFILGIDALLYSIVRHHENISDMKDMRQSWDIIYLSRILPLLFGFIAFLLVRYLLKEGTSRIQSIRQKEELISNTIALARNIDNGILDKPFISRNGHPDLAEAMESMRMNLHAAHLREQEIERQNYLVNEISTILRSSNQTRELAGEILTKLVDELDHTVQGAFYLVNETPEGEQRISLESSYAYKRRKNLKSEYRIGEGLVGQAAIEKDQIIRTEIPAEYMTVTSGLLGERKPECLLITPLIDEEKVSGVIELAAIRKFTDLETAFMKKVSLNIGRTIANIRVREKTQALLEESESMRAELSEQKQQLMESAEKMIKTQEELRQSNMQLEEQMQQTRVSNKRTNVFLENSLEVIFVIKTDGTNLFVSPSVKNVLGYYPEEIVGYNIADNLHPLDVDRLKSFAESIKSFPERRHILQFRCFTKAGEVTWLEAIGKNALDDEVINGIILNVRDISEQRLAAKEQRMRAKMQALSENSIDLILRIDIFSRCTYINPMIKKLTGLEEGEFLDKPIAGTQIDENVLATWKSLLDSVMEDREKKTEEMVFPSLDGDKIMTVSTIPEFAENGDVESALFVCHDITEAKNREELIRKKNVSISDSINYAFNIQSALMPTEKDLREHIPNSFMIYKPKDVVSGDYPYMFVDGDNVFIGAMDCTGHGVPGALMSIIGHFLQNQAMQVNSNFDAGSMLDHLHENIVSTLKQDEEDSRLNDGMDAAMVKYNPKAKTLDFAGAHRPLYHVRNGELNLIKGNRFPVGSTQYTRRTPFTNHTIRIQPGDAFYFMTDGFPDQIGGPTGKEKYMSGRVNLLIKENTHLSIFQMNNLFNRTYNEWKGDAKQVDDILIIGLKF